MKEKRFVHRLNIILAACVWGLISVPPASSQSSFDVVEAGIIELQQSLSEGSLTSVELVDLYLARIEAYDRDGPLLNSIIRIHPRARERAAELDAERARSGPRSLLHGIPILVKDNYNTTDMPTTGGSVALADFVPSENAAQIDKLLEAGAIVLAKTNLHEYAYGITSVGSLLGQTRNPYDYRRVPGGSSGGTGAAVAASFGAIGLGSDTCGSIRIPAAFNNLVGLRPSKGRSSIYGVMPLSHTQDVAGPLARSTEDLAILLDIVSGFDSRDPATGVMEDRVLPGFRETLGTVDPGDLRLGVLTDYMARADNATRQAIEAALDWFEEQGAELIEVDIAGLGDLLSQSGVISHEFRVDLNQYLSLFLSERIRNLSDIVDQGLYHEAVRGPLTRGRAAIANADAYGRALAARADVRAAVEAVLDGERLDGIVYPPVSVQPVFIGSPQPGNNCSIAANSGLPALSMPVGFSGDGLPVGMEILGRFLEGHRLLAIGHAYEQAMSPRQAPAVTPPLVGGTAPGITELPFRFTRGSVELTGSFGIDRVRNLLHYQLTVSEASGSDVYAVTLVVDGEEFELNDPIAVNLLGPGRAAVSDSYFMTPAFRQALGESKVYVKVFAEGFPVAGLSQILE